MSHINFDITSDNSTIPNLLYAVLETGNYHNYHAPQIRWFISMLEPHKVLNISSKYRTSAFNNNNRDIYNLLEGMITLTNSGLQKQNILSKRTEVVHLLNSKNPDLTYDIRIFDFYHKNTYIYDMLLNTVTHIDDKAVKDVTVDKQFKDYKFDILCIDSDGYTYKEFKKIFKLWLNKLTTKGTIFVFNISEDNHAIFKAINEFVMTNKYSRYSNMTYAKRAHIKFTTNKITTYIILYGNEFYNVKIPYVKLAYGHSNNTDDICGLTQKQIYIRDFLFNDGYFRHTICNVLAKFENR